MAWSQLQQAYLDGALLREPRGENAQGDRLAFAGSHGDEGDAAFANQLLNAPAEYLDARRGMAWSASTGTSDANGFRFNFQWPASGFSW
ncbi:hypothetical protein [Rhodoblastus sp.]|uniref:hypothetical protein n=1 Tax=Rhodoblastus sp. TaxID=1962975 RepID=UPI003F964A09